MIKVGMRVEIEVSGDMLLDLPEDASLEHKAEAVRIKLGEGINSKMNGMISVEWMRQLTDGEDEYYDEDEG